MSNQVATDQHVAARDHLAIVLDVPSLAEAVELAADVSPWFGVAKIGLELYAAAGPGAVAPLRDLGLRVFLDLKLHDIPTQVGRASRVLGRLGISYLNFHAAGGVDMLRAGVDGVREGARDAGIDAPAALGVTVLTSDPDASEFDTRLARAIEAGCDGVVCSVQEIERVKRARQDFVTVVPGVRLADGNLHDQSRVGTPAEITAAGGDVLVVGRLVSEAEDRQVAARLVHQSVVDALDRLRV